MSNDVNQATARTLVNNTGISHNLAQAIVKFRKQKQNFPITDLEELWMVPGMTYHDFEAICDEYKNPIKPRSQSKSPRNKNTSAAAANRSTSPKQGPSTGKNLERNRRKRARKRNKKKEREARNLTQSPRRSSLKRDCSRNSRTLNYRATNQRNRTRNGSPNSTLESRNSGKGRIQIPNLFFNSEIESPQNTLIRFTGRNNSGPRNMLAPFAVEPCSDGNGLVVTYKPAQVDDVEEAGQEMSPRQNFDEFFKFSALPKGRSLSKSPERPQDQSDRSRSRSRRSTFSPVEKRSRSNPTDKQEYTQNTVQVQEEWGSNLPQGPGSSTLRSDITIPANEAWAANDHENVRHWLDTVREENIISSSGGQERHYRSVSADSRQIADAPESRKGLDSGTDQPGPSAAQKTIREPTKFDGNYPGTSKKDLTRPQIPGIFTSSNPRKPLLDTWKETQEREKTDDPKKRDQSKSRHKSRHRFNNKVKPGIEQEEDERRPIEARLDRDRSLGLSAEERRQLRHRHRSKARSKDHRRRRFLNCSVM